MSIWLTIRAGSKHGTRPGAAPGGKAQRRLERQAAVVADRAAGGPVLDKPFRRRRRKQ